MPNFKPGFSLGGSFQFNLNRHFSIEGFMQFMGSISWYFDASDDGQAAFNYLYYEVYADTVDYEILSRQLRLNEATYLSSEELFSSFKSAVLNNSPNVPQYGTIQNVGDEGGDFIFIRK